MSIIEEYKRLDEERKEKVKLIKEYQARIKAIYDLQKLLIQEDYDDVLTDELFREEAEK